MANEKEKEAPRAKRKRAKKPAAVEAPTQPSVRFSTGIDFGTPEPTIEEKFEDATGEELQAEPTAPIVVSDVPDEFKEAQANWHPKPRINTLHLHRLSVGQISILQFLQIYPGESEPSVAEMLERFRGVKG